MFCKVRHDHRHLFKQWITIQLQNYSYRTHKDYVKKSWGFFWTPLNSMIQLKLTKKIYVKVDVTVLCFLSKLIKAHKLGLSCNQLSWSCSETFFFLSLTLKYCSNFVKLSASWQLRASWTETSPIITVRSTHPPHHTPPGHIW